jgi:L-threonylcarbamoyladenylate synthase
MTPAPPAPPSPPDSTEPRTPSRRRPSSGIDVATIRRAVEALRAGRLVVFPTETVYGLGADALNEQAVQRVFDLKGRPRNNPMIVHVADEAMAKRVADEWPARASVLAARFWPGPLTLVLEKSGAVPDLVTAGHRTVGVRCPDHPVALALLRAFGGPIVGPSANPSGRVSPTRAEHVRGVFAGEEPMILDGGPCRSGIESTVLSLVHDPPRILRPGAVSREEIGGDAQLASPGMEAGEESGMLAPGRLASHYAPVAPVVLFDPGDWDRVIGQAPVRTVVITHNPARIAERGLQFVRLPEGAASYAAHLYEALREADALEPELILIERPEGQGGLWTAIQDRLARAAGRRE